MLQLSQLGMLFKYSDCRKKIEKVSEVIDFLFKTVFTSLLL